MSKEFDYAEQIKQFDNNFSTVVDKRVMELSRIFDESFINNDSESTMKAIQESLLLLEQSYNVPTKMQICYNIATSYGDLRKYTDERNIEKEIYYFRYAIDLYEAEYLFVFDEEEGNIERKIAKYIAMRAYTNIGNSMKHVGRYITAIDYYNNALLIENTFAMVSLNLSFTLFRYAQIQIKPHEQQYYHHACYHYYEQTKLYKVNLESEKYLTQLEETMKSFHQDYIDNYLTKDLGLPKFKVKNPAEADYRHHILLNRLFLEPCLDILGDICFAVDSLNLPLSKDEKPIIIGLFNQIKQEYNTARYLWYESTVVRDPFITDIIKHISDNELDFITLDDTANHSYRENLLRVSFKAAYSIFDRIAFFINEYFAVGLTGSRISFKNIWKDAIKDSKGKVRYSMPNPIMKAYGDNYLVKAMYWLQKDFYEDKDTNITSPNAEPLYKMRNDMEHNCIRTVEVLPLDKRENKFTKFTTEYQIENNTYKLLKLLREIIIYLCLAINLEEKKVVNSKGR